MHLFSLSLSPLFSPHPVVLSYFSHSRFFLFIIFLKGKMDSSAILSHTCLLYEHYFPHTPLPLISTFCTLFLSLWLSSPSLLPPPIPLRVRVAWRCTSWRHHPTVNGWVCHSANNQHSSCLICLGLHGSSHDTQAVRLCLGPWRAGSRCATLRNSARAQGLFGGMVLDLSIGLWRRGTLSLIQDNILSPGFMFVQRCFADHTCPSLEMLRFRSTRLQHK